MERTVEKEGMTVKQGKKEHVLNVITLGKIFICCLTRHQKVCRRQVH